MSRLAPLDKALFLVLVPLWAICFALTVQSVVRGTVHPAVYVSAPNSGAYPSVTGFRYGSAESTLREGDELLRLGETDLRGVDPIAFRGVVGRASGSNPSPRVEIEREGERREALLPVVSSRKDWPRLFVAFFFGLLGSLGFLRSPGSKMVRAAFAAFLCLAFAQSTSFAATRLEAYAASAIFLVSVSLMQPLGVRAALVFPHGIMPGGWLRVLPWLFLPYGLIAVSSRYGIPLPGDPGGRAAGVVDVIYVVTLLLVLTRGYRRADVVERRQFKWILLGAYCAELPLLVAAVVELVEPQLGWLVVLSLNALVLLPLSALIAILRYNLFDIDRLVSATASYNIVLVALGAVALVAVPRLAESASGAVGIDPGTGQVVLSLALAAVLVPIHRRLRPQIDRLFFKERYALDHGIAELLPTLSASTDARQLTERAGSGLHRLLRPEACVVYAGVDQSYVPVFVEGRAVPPAFATTSPLVASLAARRSPLSLSDAGRRPDEAPLGPFDRAALETLRAEVVVPVRQDDALTAFLCLGPKRSGDVYTSTDLSLLAAVAETVSQKLQRLDQEETVREAREMQRSLRRYVPGAIVEQLSSGLELASGEREVSVLFVDIRGYTSFSESRRADEIFSTVNRYTETVSEIVQSHGGSVVEFNGDGMMTVFGAPRELAHKERAAVEAGREIVEAIRELRTEGTETLSVGVGIATGEAFVGNIQAVDRMIWTAIGNTTNLAARLQGLTRELDAWLVIDEATRERCHAAAADFERRIAVPIRGRRGTQDVYALPMRSDP